MTGADNDMRTLIHAYVDGELDLAHAVEVERQIAADPRLAAERDRVLALRRVIEERIAPEPLPAGLAERIQASLPGAYTPTRASRFTGFAAQPSWAALAASVLIAACLASSATWFAVRPSVSEPIADMAVASHIRALMAPQPIDVSSSDRHTVKPWFNGRISESPRVVDLSSEGFPLLGGRIDVIGHTPVPTLVYRRRQHLISLIAIPSRQSAIVPQAIAGYNIVCWTDRGVLYCAVSDVAAPDLESFAQAFRQAPL